MTTPTPQGGDPPAPDPYAGGPYASPGYGHGYGYQTPVRQQPANGHGIAALVLGILSVTLFWCYGLPGLACGVPGLIFGTLAVRRARRGEATMGYGVVGLVLSSLGLLMSITFLAAFGWAVAAAIQCADPERYPTTEAVDRCVQDHLIPG